MNCPHCGIEVDSSARFCRACGGRLQPAGATAEGPAGPAQPGQGPPAAPGYAAPGDAMPGYAAAAQPYVTFPGQPAAVAVEYGGFWIRVLAAIIDGVILSIAGAVIGAILGNDLTAQGTASVLNIIIGWLYEALMVSSERQATVGKMALGLIVTDVDGRRISFARATGRHFAKYLSAIILGIGFIMVAFDRRKQGLHDKLAGPLGVKKTNQRMSA